jgi:hypothetical protein
VQRRVEQQRSAHARLGVVHAEGAQRARRLARGERLEGGRVESLGHVVPLHLPGQRRGHGSDAGLHGLEQEHLADGLEHALGLRVEVLDGEHALVRHGRPRVVLGGLPRQRLLEVVRLQAVRLRACGGRRGGVGGLVPAEDVCVADVAGLRGGAQVALGEVRLLLGADGRRDHQLRAGGGQQHELARVHEGVGEDGVDAGLQRGAQLEPRRAGA